MTQTDPAIAALLDREAIRDVLHRYCRGCDRADEAAMRSCFHPESTHRHGGFEGRSMDFIGFAMDIVRPLIMCKHMLSNITIALAGDVAHSECHYLAYQRHRDSESGIEEDYFSGGRYLDRLERREGVWRISRRLGLLDFETFTAPTDRTLWQGPAGRRSGQWPEDPLYTEFAAVAER
ncbi:MAG: nuclear transport factor 2 family protein [Gammaproteobacteria bacterium]|nr:nuclear transport factor 2 family protein [Gammaproteobacteria bacterium]